MLELQIYDLARIAFAIITVVSLLFSFIYYIRIQHGKSLEDFFLNFLNYYGPMSLKNTSEENRKSHREVNNICMIFLWLSLIGQFVLFVCR